MTRFGRSARRPGSASAGRTPLAARTTAELQDAERQIARKVAATKQSSYTGPLRKGSAIEDAIARKLNERRSNEEDKDLLKEQALEEGDCLNKLAFYDLIDATYKAMLAKMKAKNPASTDYDQDIYGLSANPMVLDERVTILLSAAISQVLCDIMSTLRKKGETVTDANYHEKIKIRLEDIFEYLMEHHSDVILMDLDQIDVHDTLSVRRALKQLYTPAGPNSAAKLDKFQAMINEQFMTVAADNVGGRFAMAKVDVDNGTNGLSKTALEAINTFVAPGGANSKVVITCEIADVTYAMAKQMAEVLMMPIVFHMISYVIVSVVDSLLEVAMEAGDVGETFKEKVFHYNLAYPSIVAVLDLYEVPEAVFDASVAKTISTIDAVSKVFKAAKKAYDADAKPKARVYRGKANDTPAYFKTEEQKRKARDMLKGMTYINKKATTHPPQAQGATDSFPTVDAKKFAEEYAAGRVNRADVLGMPVAFGRRHKKRGSKKRASAFGKRKSRKARRGSKKRAASFGKRKARRGSKKNSFGKKRRSAGRR